MNIGTGYPITKAPLLAKNARNGAPRSLGSYDSGRRPSRRVMVVRHTALCGFPNWNTGEFDRKEDYSYRSASIGSSLEARTAGIMPLTSPTIPRITVET